MQTQLISILSETYKNHTFVAEEPSELSSQEMVDAEHVWVIDPIDGSHNFASKVALFTISVCYYYRGEPQVAWVYDPINDELFSAITGYGATLNQKRIRLAQSDTLTGLAGTEFRSMEKMSALLTGKPVHSLRQLGSISLTLCYLASGRFDIAFCESPRIWDMAAGMLIAQEAGARLVNEGGQRFENGDECLIASTQGILDHFTQ